LKRKLILGVTTIALALAMVMIVPLASADNNNDQSKHDDQSKHNDQSKHDDQSNNDQCNNDQSKNNDDDKSKCHDDDESTTQVDDAKWKSDIEKTIAFLTDKINTMVLSSTGQSSTSTTSPTAIYSHLDIGICTIDPILLTPQGWCPDGITTRFFIPNANVTKYSVISTTTVTPVTNPLAAVQCGEETINYVVGSNQGFGITCNFPPLPGSGLNYIVFNPSKAWYTAHNITP